MLICFVGLFTAIDAVEAERTVESFERLAGLVVQHFADEEQLGLTDAHKAIHVDLVNTAVAKLGELKNGAPIDDALIAFLKDWLMNHIKGNDIPSYGSR